jgi:hypothetical protein
VTSTDILSVLLIKPNVFRDHRADIFPQTSHEQREREASMTE